MTSFCNNLEDHVKDRSKLEQFRAYAGYQPVLKVLNQVANHGRVLAIDMRSFLARADSFRDATNGEHDFIVILIRVCCEAMRNFAKYEKKKLIRLIRIEIEYKEHIANDLTQLMQFIGINPSQVSMGGDLEGRRFTCTQTGKVYVELLLSIERARSIFPSSKEIFQLLIQDLRTAMSHSLIENNTKVAIPPKFLCLLSCLCPGVQKYIDEDVPPPGPRAPQSSTNVIVKVSSSSLSPPLPSHSFLPLLPLAIQLFKS